MKNLNAVEFQNKVNKTFTKLALRLGTEFWAMEGLKKPTGTYQLNRVYTHLKPCSLPCETAFKELFKVKEMAVRVMKLIINTAKKNDMYSEEIQEIVYKIALMISTTFGHVEKVLDSGKNMTIPNWKHVQAKVDEILYS